MSNIDTDRLEMLTELVREAQTLQLLQENAEDVAAAGDDALTELYHERLAELESKDAAEAEAKRVAAAATADKGDHSPEPSLQARLRADIERYIDGDALLLDAPEFNRATLGETESGVRGAVKAALAARYLELKGYACDIDGLFPAVELKPAPAAAEATEKKVSFKVETDFTKALPWSGFMHLKTKADKEGNTYITGLLPTIENLEHMLRCYGIGLRYNEMTHLREVDIPQFEASEDNRDERAMNLVHNLCVINGMAFGVDHLSGAVSTIAERNCYHPVKQWIESKVWDGHSRLEALCDTLAVRDPGMAAYRNRIMKRWLVSGAAALYSKDWSHKYELALTLQGLQGKGKSFWFLSLLPTELRAVKDNMELDPRDKDDVFRLAGHFIVELGELDTTFSKTTLGRLKGFMSQTSDKLRRPYARCDSVMKRRTIIGSSVNKPDFLLDDTGNRRWLTLPCISAKWQHGIDMQQLWAEMKVLFEQGEQWWLTDEERAEVDHVNERFEATIPVVEMLQDAFEFLRPGEQDDLPGMERPKVEDRKALRITATQVAALFGLAKDRKTVSEAGAALRKLTGAESVKSNGQMVWYVYPRKGSTHVGAVRGMFGQAVV